jgi:hypothetical protein
VSEDMPGVPGPPPPPPVHVVGGGPEHPVRVGSMLFTLVDPHQGHEVAYNRWYERDHFYAGCMVGPWLFAGGRFVATRELKDLRFPASSPFAEPVGAGSYLALYWIHQGHVGEHLRWAGDQVRELYSQGRGFQERTHAHTGLYDLQSVAYADPEGVPLELSLDHGFAGLAVLVIEPPGGETASSAAARLADDAARDLLAGSSPAASSSWWAVRRSARTKDAKVPMALGSDGGSEERLVQLVFLEVDPREWWPGARAYAELLESAGAGRVTFAAPFLPTVVGTDTYADQLW